MRQSFAFALFFFTFAGCEGSETSQPSMPVEAAKPSLEETNRLPQEVSQHAMYPEVIKFLFTKGYFEADLIEGDIVLSEDGSTLRLSGSLRDRLSKKLLDEASADQDAPHLELQKKPGGGSGGSSGAPCDVVETVSCPYPTQTGYIWWVSGTGTCRDDVDADGKPEYAFCCDWTSSFPMGFNYTCGRPLGGTPAGELCLSHPYCRNAMGTVIPDLVNYPGARCTSGGGISSGGAVGITCRYATP